MQRVEPAAEQAAAGVIGELWDDIADELAGQAEPVAEAGRLLLARLAARFSADGSVRSVLADPTENPIVHIPLWLANRHGKSKQTATAIARAALAKFCATAAASDAEMPEALVACALRYGTRSLPIRLRRPATAQAEEHFDDAMVALFPFVARLCEVWLDHPDVAAACRALGEALRFERDLTALAAPGADIETSLPAGIVVDRLGGMVPSGPLLPALAIPAVRNAVFAAWDRHLETAAAAWAGVAEAAGCVAGLRSRRRWWDDLVDGSPVSLPRVTWWGRHEPPALDSTARAIAMAEGYLTGEGAIRSTWIEQRRGLGGRQRVVAPFPAGMVLEALANHGDAGELIDDHIATLRSQRYAFYDSPELSFVDTDTIGSLLRLYPYSSQDPVVGNEVRALVVAALSGDPQRIPVWIEPATEDSSITLLGEHCATIEAGFLRGLLVADLGLPFPLAAAERLLGDFAVRGAGISVNYPAAMLLVAVRRLLEALEHTGPPTAARASASRRISLEAARLAGTVSPQTAAWLVLSTPQGDQPTRRAWQETILERQRHDGGWDGEPLFFVTGIDGEPEWYRNRAVSTAICYEALSMLAE